MAQGGKSLNDRKQSARVRQKLLNLVEKILDGDNEAEKKELLLKMCTGLLPKLNEHTGEDGTKLFPQPLLAGKSNVPNYNGTEKTTDAEETD